MNERIKELALQASENHDYHPEFAKKFAELIVRECISTIEQARFQEDVSAEDYDSGYVDGMGQAERILKEHFGVAE